MIKIKEIKTREILNSVGKKAIEVEIRTENNIRAISSSPSAIIPGKREVITKTIRIVGDDLFATQDKYVNSELANGIIIKMNQVGTLTGTIKAFHKAKEENMITCVSQRSIETEDTFMCDLAVALNATYIKIGGPRRGDRIAKYNRLLRLEEQEKEII